MKKRGAKRAKYLVVIDKTDSLLTPLLIKRVRATYNTFYLASQTWSVARPLLSMKDSDINVMFITNSLHDAIGFLVDETFKWSIDDFRWRAT